MDFSLRKSFNKSHGSYKHMRKISAGGGADSSYEEQPILLDHQDHAMRPSADRREVIVKIDGGDKSRDTELNGGGNAGNVWRESSYDFWKDNGGKKINNNGNANRQNGGAADGEGFSFQNRAQTMEDPPSKLIGQFLHKQRASGEMSLDMDLEMDELRQDRGLPPVAESPSNRMLSSKELKVSFHPPNSNNVEVPSESVRRRHKDSSDEDEHHLHQQQQQHNRRSSNITGGEVLRCTANASFKRNSSLLRVKTRSRLMDPLPNEPDRRSGRVAKSGQLKSGMMSKAMDEEEDDPFIEEDLPDEFKKANLSALTLLQWVSLVVILGAFICNLSVPALKGRTLWNLQLWKWEVLVLVLICGRLVSGWGIRIIVFFIERNFLLRKRVLYFVYGVRKAVQNCLWLGLVLIAWHYLFDKKVQRETKTSTLQLVTKILVCLLVGTLLWLVKTLMVKVLASSFHVSTFFDRIQDSLFNQYVIETLSGPPLIEIQNLQEDEERTMAEVRKLQNAGATVPPDLKATAFPSIKSGRVIGSGGLQRTPRGKSAKLSRVITKKQDEGITIDHLHKLNTKNISAWNMKRLMNIVRHGVISTLDEQILESTHEDDSGTHIRSELEAKAAARKVFQNVSKHGSKYIYLEDLTRFMREDEATKTMSLFEGASENQKISKTALKNWVVNAFRERRALALTLNDTKTAVNKLHHMVNIVIGIIIGVIWLLILGIATSKFLVFISSQILVVVFIFGNTCKTVFEAIIFLFVMHPFDVGDRCEIDGVQMVVEEMNILTTVFLRYDNQKIIYPNSVLSTKPIHNYYRSPDMGDAIDFCVHISTPAEKIAMMKQRIISYVENKTDHWQPAPMIVLKDVEDLNRLKIAVWLSHRMNHQDMGERWVRRALLVEEMVKIFKELDIEYRMLPLNVNVRSLPPITSTRSPSNWTTSAE